MTLTDTGPLVVLPDEDDDLHEPCAAAAKRPPMGPTLTTVQTSAGFFVRDEAEQLVHLHDRGGGHGPRREGVERQAFVPSSSATPVLDWTLSR